MPSLLPKMFVIGSSATLLMDPYLKQMLHGFCEYSRKGHEQSEIQDAFKDLDVPRGASAGNSSMVLEYLHALDQTGNFAADVCLMHVGFHDIKRNPQNGQVAVPLDLYRSNVAKIIDWFDQKNIRLVWMRSGPLDEKLHNERSKSFHRFEVDVLAYNDAAEVLLKEHGVPVLDLDGFTRRLGPMDQLLKDHVHFADEVIKLQSAFIAGYLAGLRS